MKQDTSRSQLTDPSNHIEQCGLSRARFACDSQELARPDVNVDIVERHERDIARVVGFYDSLHLNDGILINIGHTSSATSLSKYETKNSIDLDMRRIKVLLSSSPK